MIRSEAQGSGVDLAEPLRLRKTRDGIEERNRVGADFLVRRHQADVAVKAGCDLVVVAGAEMDIADDAVRLAANDNADLGVRFQPFDPVNDLHAGPLQVARPFDVAGLVEAGP